MKEIALIYERIDLNILANLSICTNFKMKKYLVMCKIPK